MWAQRALRKRDTGWEQRTQKPCHALAAAEIQERLSSAQPAKAERGNKQESSPEPENRAHTKKRLRSEATAGPESCAHHPMQLLQENSSSRNMKENHTQNNQYFY